MTNGPPRISVITPSYNQAEFLEQCIRSVLDQDYPNLEYIIIDGGSGDDSVSIIRKYEQRLTFWVSETDGGQSDAINKGFRRASGELVAWLNSDDYYLPGALHAIAAAYRQNSQASFYFGDGVRVDRGGGVLSGFCPVPTVTFHHPALIWGLNYILQPATFMRRDLLAEVGYLDTRLKYGMDSDLWLKLAAQATPQPIQAKLAASREYRSTKTATGSFARIEELRQIAEKHCGVPMTLGVMCYFLDTLLQQAAARPDVFAEPFPTEVMRFWKAIRKMLARIGARHDGFPLPQKLRAEAAPRIKVLQVVQHRISQARRAAIGMLRHLAPGRKAG